MDWMPACAGMTIVDMACGSDQKRQAGAGCRLCYRASMEARSDNRPADLLEPRSLAMLMKLYEANYRRLLGMLGEPAHWPRRFSLKLRGRPVLHVEVTQRARYT